MSAAEPVIYLSGAGGMGNLGAEAILLAVIQLYQERLPQARFILAAWNPDRVRELLRGIPGRFEVVPQRVPLDGGRDLRSSDVFVVCGDIALTETVIRILPCYWSFKALWARLHGCRVLFLGVEVEAIRMALNRLAIRRVLNPVTQRCLVRNPESLANMEQLGARPPALLLGCEPALMIRDESLQAFPAPGLTWPGGQLRVGFGIRDHFGAPLHLDLRRLKLRRRDVAPGRLSQEMQNMVARLADHLVEKHNARIVFIPHYFAEGKERVILTDREISTRVQEQMKHADCTVMAPEYLHPYAAMNLYRQLDLVVSMRHHANAFAFRFGVPTVGLAVNQKVVTHFRQMGMEDLLIDPRDTDSARAEAVVDRAVQDRKSISARMKDLLAQAQTQMNQALDVAIRHD